MENAIQITSIPLIVAVVYVLLAAYKKLVGEKEKLIRLIPLIAATGTNQIFKQLLKEENKNEKNENNS